MKEALFLISEQRLNPAVIVTHVGALKSVVDTTLHHPEIPGGKKLTYTNIDMPPTPIPEFAEKGKDNEVFAKLAEITPRNRGLSSVEAQKYLPDNSEKLN